MKKCLCVFFLAGILCFLPVLAIGADSVKIGIVDLQRCIMESEEGKNIKTELIGKRDEMQKKLDEKQNNLLELKKELEKQSMMLSMEAKEDKAKEFERQRREFKYFIDDLSGQMKKAEDDAKKRLLKELGDVVDDIGKKGNFTLIFEKRSGGIMYFDNALDVTDEVIAAYDRTKK